MDLEIGTIRDQRKLAALRIGPLLGSPQSKAGNRVVTIPTIALEPLREHVGEFVGAELDAIIFTGDKGALLRTGNYLRTVKGSSSGPNSACGSASPSTTSGTRGNGMASGPTCGS